MIGDTIRCKQPLIQLIKDYSSDLIKLSLTLSDWLYLEQLYEVLSLFNEYTKFVSQTQPTITIVPRIFLNLSQLLYKIAGQEDNYTEYNLSITNAVKAALPKLKEYNRYVDDTIIYFVAAVLDPRLKGDWIKSQYKNGNTIISSIRDYIRKAYPESKEAKESILGSGKETIQMRMLQALYKDRPLGSDVDRYLDGPLVQWDAQSSSTEDFT
jgi:hypothetical protein